MFRLTKDETEYARSRSQIATLNNGGSTDPSSLRSQIATTEVIEDEYVTLLRSQIATAKLVENELDTNLRSKNLTSSWGRTRKLPYVFTEQGIYMLMTVF